MGFVHKSIIIFGGSSLFLIMVQQAFDMYQVITLIRRRAWYWFGQPQRAALPNTLQSSDFTLSDDCSLLGTGRRTPGEGRWMGYCHHSPSVVVVFCVCQWVMSKTGIFFCGTKQVFIFNWENSKFIFWILILVTDLDSLVLNWNQV